MDKISIKQTDKNIVNVSRENIESAIKDYDEIFQPLLNMIRRHMKLGNIYKPRDWKDNKHGVLEEIVKEHNNTMLQSELINKYCTKTNTSVKTAQVYITKWVS